MRFLPSFDRWRSGLLNALARFPLNLASGLTGALAMIASIDASEDHAFVGQCIRLAMTAALGMPLFFSLRMLRERFDRLQAWPIEVVGLPLLVAWFFAQPSNPVDAPGIVLIRWLLLLAALHFFAAVSAYLHGAEGLGFWQFNRRLFLRFCLAALYAGVLTIGLELALLSANKLFNLQFDKAYADLFFLMAGVFQPAFFLAGVPSNFHLLDADIDYPRGLKAFTQFALAPLVAVYTAILCLYTAKILIGRTWPHGWVAFPVLLLAGVGILAFLLLSPLRVRAGERWAVWFTCNFPRALAPLSILLLLSLRVRIADYGVTEERYLGVVAGIWILSWAIVFILRKNAGIRWIPYSLAAICVLSAFGPWSAGAISKKSQLSRITQILQANGLWKNDHAAPAADAITLTKKTNTDLRTTLAYLIRMHGRGTIQRIFEALPVGGSADGGDLIAALKITNAAEWEGGPYVNRIRNASIDIQGFRRVWHLNAWNLNSGGRDTGDCPDSHHEDVKIRLEHGLLTIATDQERFPQSIPVESLINRLETKPGADLPDSNLTVDFTHGARSFRIIFDSLSLYADQEKKRIQSCEIYLLEK